VAVSTAAASPAAATVVTDTFLGTVGASDDGLDLFGGGSLYQAPFSLVVTLDTSKGPTDQGCLFAVYCEANLHGGTAYNTPASVTAALTVNGLTFAFAGTTESGVNVAEDSAVSQSLIHLTGTNGAGVTALTVLVRADDPNTFPITLGALPTLTVDGVHIKTILGDFSVTNGQDLASHGDLDIAAINPPAPPPPPPVPEPAAWSLMLIGASLTGAAIRRRRAAAA
jgi:hypothetical protein